MTAITLAPQQDAAIAAASDWIKNRTAEQQVFRLFGYAGTGKTTIAKRLAEGLDGDVVYAAFTGKAALMMQKSGCPNAKTIHSLIYKPVAHKDGTVEFVLNLDDSPVASAELVIIDECSMVGEELARDLLKFGKPILVLGDPAQLPPVKSGGFFTDHEPDAMLTEIHRQAKENPILRLATDIRRGKWAKWRDEIPLNDDPRLQIMRRGTLSADEIVAADQVLVGRNVTRQAYNRQIRKHLRRSCILPVANDRLVCLRNEASTGIFNGGIFTVKKRMAHHDDQFVKLKIASDDFDRDAIIVKVRREFFEGGHEDIPWRELKESSQFDYGYALTCHKAQGSQWPHVIAYDESGTFRDDAGRWLYTAVTRASEKLTLVI